MSDSVDPVDPGKIVKATFESALYESMERL